MSSTLPVSEFIVGVLSPRIQMVVILTLRVIFLTANKRRDRAFAEGRREYDPNPKNSYLNDVSDWKNPAFRYIGECLRKWTA